MKGKAFWGECDLYRCTVRKGLHYCGQCDRLPSAALTKAIENGHQPDRLENLTLWNNTEKTKLQYGGIVYV